MSRITNNAPLGLQGLLRTGITGPVTVNYLPDFADAGKLVVYELSVYVNPDSISNPEPGQSAFRVTPTLISASRSQIPQLSSLMTASQSAVIQLAALRP